MSYHLTMPTLKTFQCVYYLCRNKSVCLQIHVWPINFFCFDIGLQYLSHGFITMRECVKCIHDPDTTLDFDIKVKIYRVCDMALCSGLSYFVL